MLKLLKRLLFKSAVPLADYDKEVYSIAVHNVLVLMRRKYPEYKEEIASDQRVKSLVEEYLATQDNMTDGHKLDLAEVAEAVGQRLGYVY